MGAKRLFLRCAWPIYARISALAEVVGALPDPVLVYQMSKVGSSSVERTLTRAGIPHVHVHFIAPASWEETARWHAKNDQTLPPHFHKGRLLRYWINWTERQVRVVTLVRDPIARHVSGAFEVGHQTGFPKENKSKALQALGNQLRAKDVLDYPYTWFDREIAPVFGVDVLDHPFNRKEGYGRIKTENVDLLILTLERLSDLVPTVLSDFVGTSLELKKARIRTDEVYKRVKEQLTLSESNVRRLYDHPWMRHFYAEQDIERFVRRWTETHPHHS